MNLFFITTLNVVVIQSTRTEIIIFLAGNLNHNFLEKNIIEKKYSKLETAVANAAPTAPNLGTQNIFIPIFTIKLTKDISVII